MTNQEAETQAKQRFGSEAFAIIEPNGANKYWVGEYNGPFRQYYGRGKSWEEAFAEARLILN